MAFACECVTVGNAQGGPELLVRSDLAIAPVIFVGKVTSVIDISDPTGFPEGRSLTLQRRVTFAVEESWKGVRRGNFTVITGIGAGDCGFHFDVGIRYLVVTTDAHLYPQKEPQVGICSNTAKAETAQAYISVIRHMKTARPFVNSP